MHVTGRVNAVFRVVFQFPYEDVLIDDVGANVDAFTKWDHGGHGIAASNLYPRRLLVVLANADVYYVFLFMKSEQAGTLEYSWGVQCLVRAVVQFNLIVAAAEHVGYCYPVISDVERLHKLHV